MLESSSKNRRIARNTVLLYGRTLLTMLVALYASRIVLLALGKNDYGIYSVVGGVAAMFTMLSSSMLAATQRFLSYAMGQGHGERARKIFATAITCHALVALILVVVAETVGLWFVKTQLVIPADRMAAAVWVYHCSVAIMFTVVVATPFNALVVAHEKMSVYAAVSVTDAVLKLLAVFVLQALQCDRLIMYGLFLLLVTLLVNMAYMLYCRKKFVGFSPKPAWNRKMAKRLMSFSGWMVAGVSADILSSQGVNMLINIFFGTLMNTARGLAAQVQTGVYMLAANVVTAVKPQIVESYARREYRYMYKLVFSSSKFAFLLLYTVSLPVLLQTEYVLQLWLKNVPEQTAVFVRLILVDTLIQTLVISTASVSQASGKIRGYQTILTAGFLLEFCLTALFFGLGYPVYSTFAIAVGVSATVLAVRLVELKRSVNFPVTKFLTEVTARLFVVVLLSLALPLLCMALLPPSFFRFCGIVALSTVCTLMASWFAGFSKFEKDSVKQRTVPLLNKSERGRALLQFYRKHFAE